MDVRNPVTLSGAIPRCNTCLTESSNILLLNWSDINSISLVRGTGVGGTRTESALCDMEPFTCHLSGIRKGLCELRGEGLSL